MDYSKSLVLSIYCLLTTVSVCCQKTVRKTVLSPATTLVRIDANNCFEVNVGTTQSEAVEVTADLEGEYAEDLLITLREEGSTLSINTNFQPNFKNPNDKLSAHKVVSIRLEISLPPHKNLSIYGSDSNVILNGVYKDVRVILNDGACRLGLHAETITVRSQSGPIYLSVPVESVMAKSRYGQVIGQAEKNGHGRFELITATGDIHLKETK